jgi:polyhydroxybutyrate depolymerase
MVKSIYFALAPIALAEVKLYDPETHVPRASTGCGSTSPYTAGSTTTAHATYDGVRYEYRVYVPKSYKKNTPTALVLQHHGWGMTAQSEQKGSGIADYADAQNYIAVFPQGSGDNTHNGGPWYSWNAVGTTQSPGPAGATCTQKASTQSYCYTSCAPCRDSPQCEWTTCNDEVTPTGTGTTKVNGYIPSLYDTLESQLCIDTTREYVAGESNGGMMTYQVAVDMADRLAAAAPQFGSFHRGYSLSPKTGVPVIDIHGTKDTTVPANVSLSGDGYYYTTTDQIFFGDEYSDGWTKSNGCTGASSHYKTNYDGIDQLYCVSEGSCSGGDVVRCAWNGGHNWYGNSATLNGGLVSDFLVQWTKPSHIGFGYTVGEEVGEPNLLQDIEIVDEEPAPELGAHLPVTLTPSATGHYGNPKDGCLDDEKVVNLGSGSVCALDVQVDKAAEVPEPACLVGGLLPEGDNGCPIDAPVSKESKAFPICIAKNDGDHAYDDGDFMCALACPCEIEKGEDGKIQCNDASHKQCPDGAFCERGELRHMANGICTYPMEASSVFA